MPYHIKRPSILGDVGDVYYTGGNSWSDNFSDRKIYEDDPSSIFANPDGKNGGFTGASAVSE